MKRVFVIIMAICLMMGFAACGVKDGANTTASKEGESAVATTEETIEETTEETTEKVEINVAYIAKETNIAFHATLNGAAKVALDALVGDGTIASWQLYDGQNDPSIQVSLLEDAINNGANFVVFLPAESDGSAPVLTRCSELDIPIIIVNSQTNNTEELATAYVGSNDVEAGEMMADYVMEKLPEGGKYAHMLGIVGNSAQIQRGQGIENKMTDIWECVGEYPCEWTGDKAVQAATDVLTQYGDEIKSIICDNDDMSSAVQAYCNSIGREDVVCIGVDGNAGPLGMVKAGTLGATIFQDGANQVATAISLIPEIIAGNEVEKNIMVPFVLVTAENVDDYLN